jgi:hypothetical protein
MDISNLSSAQLARAIRLVKKRETLQAQLDGVVSELASLEGGSPVRRGRKPGRPPKSAGRPPGRPPGRKGRRGKRLKDSLLKALKSAGAEGITVKDLAAKLKVKPNNVFSWFYTTGKKVSGIKKVGEARYALAS